MHVTNDLCVAVGAGRPFHVRLWTRYRRRHVATSAHRVRPWSQIPDRRISGRWSLWSPGTRLPSPAAGARLGAVASEAKVLSATAIRLYHLGRRGATVLM